MRLSVITPSTTALAAPAPDHQDPVNDGGFAAALSGVLRPAAARPPEVGAHEPKREKTAEPKRDTPPVETRQPVDGNKAARQDLAVPSDAKDRFAVEAIAETTETAATETAITAAATVLTDEDMPADKDAKPVKPAASKPRKTDETDNATPPAMPAAAPMTPQPAPLAGQPDPQGNGSKAAGIAGAGETSGVIAPIDAGDVETDTADLPVADKTSAADANMPAFAQELARQNGPAGTAKAEAPQPPSAPAAAAPAEQVAVKLATAANGKGDRIRIQLSPESLGKVDVQLDLGDDGQVKAVIRADKPETLHLLMHDARHLVRGLQEAGFQAQASDLQFNLNGDSDQRRQSAFAQAAFDQAGSPSGSGRGESAAPAGTPSIYRSLGRAAHGGVDLSI